MASSCQNLLNALKECLIHSDCVMKQENLPSDCLKNHFTELPEECQSLRKATFECKRGMVRLPSSFSGALAKDSLVGYEETLSREHYWITV